jgi:hypothetical protein
MLESLYSTDHFANIGDADIHEDIINKAILPLTTNYAVINHVEVEDLSPASVELHVENVKTPFGEVASNSDWELRRVTPILTIVKKNIPGVYQVMLHAPGLPYASIGSAIIGATLIPTD